MLNDEIKGYAKVTGLTVKLSGSLYAGKVQFCRATPLQVIRIKASFYGKTYKIWGASLKFHKESLDIHTFLAIMGWQKDYCV